MGDRCRAYLIWALVFCLSATLLLLCNRTWVRLITIVLFIIAIVSVLIILLRSRKRLIKYLPCVFACITITLFCLMLTIAFVAALSGNYSLQFDLDGFQNMIQFWRGYDILISSFAGSASIWIASYTLNKSLDIYAFNSLTELRSRFNDPGKKALHLFLMKNSDDAVSSENTDYNFAERMKNNARVQSSSDESYKNQSFDSTDVFDYLGVVELGAIMLKRNLISFSEFYNQFGYRIEYLLENDEVRKHIMSDETREYYDLLWEVIRDMRQRNKLNLKEGILREIDESITKKS